MNSLQHASSAFQVGTPSSFDTLDLSSWSSRKTTVRVPRNNSEWYQELEDRLNELVSLPLGWDGYAGEPVSFSCADFAAKMIERLCIENVAAPQLVPGSDGTIQLEWHSNGYDVEVDILAPLDVLATRYNLYTDEEEVLEIQSDFTELANWIRMLRQPHEEIHQMQG